jgi:hypothetical protein
MQENLTSAVVDLTAVTAAVGAHRAVARIELEGVGMDMRAAAAADRKVGDRNTCHEVA